MNHPEILAQPGYISATLADTEPQEVFPGIRLHTLWRASSGVGAHILQMDPGTSWPHRDVHDPGPEEVYVISGIFNDGARDYEPGTFLHAPAGTWHVPSTTTGCALFLFYPEA